MQEQIEQMDRSKLNSFSLKIAKDLIQARPSIPLSVAIGVANVKMANICSQLSIQIDTKSGYPVTPANIYQLVLLNSGGGKGASLSLVDQFYFKDAFDYMDEIVYPKFKEKALQKLEEEDNDRPIHNWTKSVSNSTTSGLFALAESFSLCGLGGINLEVDEIGNAIVSKAELFEILLQPYDNGVFEPVAKRTDANAISVKNMSVNLYSFGNKVRLFNGDNVETSFLNLLDEGYGRRFIFVDDNSIPSRKSPEDIMAEMDASDEISNKRKEDREFIKGLVTSTNLGKVLELDRDARLIWATIKSDGDNYILDNKGLLPAVKADMSERAFKVAKLAGIYAFFDGNEKVTGKNMEEAFEVIKESSLVLKELRKVKPLHKRLLDKLLDEENAVTSQHCLSYPFINNTWSKKVLEVLDLAKQLASEEGYRWKEITKKGVIYYSVTRTEETKQIDPKDEEIAEAKIKEAIKEEESSDNMSQEELLKRLGY